MTLPPGHPFSALLGAQPAVILDGGLATTLEARGHDLDDPLWSARLLIEAPEAIRQLHLDFLKAGADCIVTSTYQASFEGFRGRGIAPEQAAELMRLSVDLAIQARDAFWSDPAQRHRRQRPLVAASIGPYGAYLADGSEYRGDYGVDDQALRSFHLERWRLLAASPADLLACETIPSAREAAVLLGLLRETPDRWAWMSFSCRDGRHLCDGTPIGDVAQLCGAEPRVAAVGVNCTAPRFVESLLAEVRRVTDVPLIAYPSSGERYDPEGKAWVTATVDAGATAARSRSEDAGDERPASWLRTGAVAIGGCCRVAPRQIRAIRSLLLGGAHRSDL